MIHDQNCVNTAVKAREPDKPNIPASQQAQTNPLMLEVGSAIQCGENLVQYGTIKRIEDDPISNKEIAEVEMVSYLANMYIIITIF